MTFLFNFQEHLFFMFLFQKRGPIQIKTQKLACLMIKPQCEYHVYSQRYFFGNKFYLFNFIPNDKTTKVIYRLCTIFLPLCLSESFCMCVHLSVCLCVLCLSACVSSSDNLFVFYEDLCTYNFLEKYCIKHNKIGPQRNASQI